MSNLYNKDSIEHLSPLEFTRLRPGVYCGDTTYSTQLILELVSNSIDEHVLGHGNDIYVFVSDYKLMVSDCAQGFPLNVFNDDGTSVLEAAFSVLNTSGKYREDGVYEGTSLGLNGIGAKLCVFLSHWAEVTSWHNRGQEVETVKFKEGEFQERDNTPTSFKVKDGTTVSFHPSKEFFKHVEPDSKALKKFFFEVTCLCPDLVIHYTNELTNEKIDFHNPDGLSALLKEKIKDSYKIGASLIFQEKKDKQSVNAALAYSTDHSSNIIAYVNYGLTDAGPHITAIKSCLTRTLNKWAKEQGLLKAKDKNLDGASLQEGLVLIFNLVAPNISYDAQTKSRIVSNDFVPFLNAVFSKQIEVWLDNHASTGKQIIEKALVARRAAEAAKKAREQVREKNKFKTASNKVEVLPSKLTDANSKDRSICELYIVEGDSASGGAKAIRNAKTQGIMPLRGKPLNVLTAQVATIQKNQEIMNIISALGLTWSSDKKHINYNEKALRYEKLIIAADRDRDGSHIQTLILTMIWTLFPDLLLDGHVYVALPPLYKAEWGTKYQYIADQHELEEFQKTHSNFSLSYYKGLGEASPQELGQMIMDPQTRHIEQVTVDDMNELTEVINNLMGKATTPKKEFVFGAELKEII